MSAITITTGTKTLLIRSASNCILGLSDCARLTRSTKFDSTESRAAAVTWAFKLPPISMDPPIMLSFGFLFTGRLSPLIVASSTWASPHRIFASAGICSPFRISTRSPLQAGDCPRENDLLVLVVKGDVLAVTFVFFGGRYAGCFVSTIFQIIAGQYQRDGRVFHKRNRILQV